MSTTSTGYVTGAGSSSPRLLRSRLVSLEALSPISFVFTVDPFISATALVLGPLYDQVGQLGPANIVDNESRAMPVNKGGCHWSHMSEAHLVLRVQPGTRANQVVGLTDDGVLRVRVAAPATDGRANRALVGLMVGLLLVPKSRITIVRGLGSRNKVVVVEGLDREQALARLIPP